jgi:2-C-methyl-D-erythritol 2,4-cyclodiphosphate synthase
MSQRFRIGQGFDVHALVPGRRLVLGGVEIPHSRGLLGHSDADVLLHAITDAVLGAAGLGDIGAMFPDSDPQFEGADSADLLRLAVNKVTAAGWQIENIDATVIAESPKIGPHVSDMRDRISAVCAIGRNAVSIKGKTTEKLGLTGRGEGIAAQAVVLISSNN